MGMRSRLFSFLSWRNVNPLTLYICRCGQMLLCTSLCNSTLCLALTLHHEVQKLAASGLTRCHHCIKNKSKLLRWADPDMRGGPESLIPWAGPWEGTKNRKLGYHVSYCEDTSEESVMGKGVSRDFHLNPGELWVNPLECARRPLPASRAASMQPWEPPWKVLCESPLESIHSWCDFHMEVWQSTASWVCKLHVLSYLEQSFSMLYCSSSWPREQICGIQVEQGLLLKKMAWPFVLCGQGVGFWRGSISEEYMEETSCPYGIIAVTVWDGEKLVLTSNHLSSFSPIKFNAQPA